MIFVLESYLKNHRREIKAWKQIIQQGAPIIFITLVVIASITFIATRPPKKIDPNNPNGCSPMVKKDDKVAVQTSDFDGSEGIVIQQKEDCTVDLRLTKSTYTFEICKKSNDDFYCKNTKEIGTILHVNNNDHIVKL